MDSEACLRRVEVCGGFGRHTIRCPRDPEYLGSLQQGDSQQSPQAAAGSQFLSEVQV